METKFKIFDVILVLVLIGVIILLVNGFSNKVREDKAAFNEPMLVSEVGSDVPSISEGELFIMLKENPYSAKVMFETPTKITGVVKSISTNGMTITLSSGSVEVDCVVRDIYLLGNVYKRQHSGKEVFIQQRDVLKKYTQQLSNGDTITLIGYELRDKNESDGYIIKVRNFDILDMVTNMGLEDEEALFDELNLFDEVVDGKSE